MFIDNYPITPRSISPDAPAHILADLSSMSCLREIKEEFVRGAKARQNFMCWQQQRINEVSQALRWRRAEGIGEKIATVQRDIYFQMMELYGADCWSDPKFVESFLEKNPGVRIKTEAPVTVVHPGLENAA